MDEEAHAGRTPLLEGEFAGNSNINQQQSCQLPRQPFQEASLHSQSQDQQPSESPDQQQHSNEDNHTSHSNEVLKILRLALSFGKHAIQYGSVGTRVESCLRKMVIDELSKLNGLGNCEVFFSVSNSEIIACVSFDHTNIADIGLMDAEIGGDVGRNYNENQSFAPPITIITGVKEGMHLKKLALLGELAKQIHNGEISLDEAVPEKLYEIDQSKNPYNLAMEFVLGWMVVGTGLPLVLSGSWYDSLVSTFGGAIAFCTTMLFQLYAPKYSNSWGLACSSFLPAILISVVRLYCAQINVVISVLSSVAIPLPGYTVSLGLVEMAANRVIRGAGHLISGMVTLLWLVGGGYAGVLFIKAVKEVPPEFEEYVPSPVDRLWMILFIPLIAIALNVAFQISRSDFLPALLVSILSYLITAIMSYYTKASSNFATLLSAAVCTICANGFSRILDKPQPIILTPTIVFLVSGSIGYRGLANFLGGNNEEGAEQFWQMFLVAILIAIGLLAGNTLVEPDSTL